MHRIKEWIYTHYTEKVSISEEGGHLPKDIKKVSNSQIIENSGFKVKRYQQLVRCIAELGFLNQHFNLLYRGQDKDYKNKKGFSEIYPSIYRSKSEIPSVTTIQERFGELRKIRTKLRINKKDILLQRGIMSYPEYYYALIQHYQIYPTPLIDLTQSLRVAATFALRKSTTGFVLVFGMPHPQGSISHFIDQEMVLVKLQNVCPPSALRPHYQEGYLAGKLPFKSEKQVGDNLARRLIGKYYIDNSDGNFWNKGFSEIPEEALFPVKDPFQRELKEVLEQE